ncbi:unnamed protein product, partial [Staurois parvus]
PIKCHPSVLPVSCVISTAASQCHQSVLDKVTSATISDHHCCISVQHHQCLLINAHQCCLISATTSVQPISAAYLCHHISAHHAHQCTSMPHISAHLSCLSVLPSSAHQ